MENEFKAGDRVRATERLMYLPANITGVVVGKCPDGRFKVCIDEEDDLNAFYYPEQLELIEKCDRKRAFLSELKALLEKYDASFTDSDDYRIYASIGDSANGPGFYWEMNEHNGYQLNADSIMDCKDN